MSAKTEHNRAGHGRLPFLTRLRRDTRGNTLAMMAAALVPMIGMAGGAIDMTRLYVVKVRLQQACDAGVLAGRKFMLDDGKPALDANATSRANDFFTNNFRTGLFGATTPTFTPTKTSKQRVAGVASATVPMTLMRYFASPSQRISVECEAQYDIADIDTMFVLDTTGSMSCTASASTSCSGATATYTRSDGTKGYYATESTDSKLDALRDAVVLFDTTVRQNADPSTNIRYGFVPYASAVNVGRLIPPQYLLASQWGYETRRAVADRNAGALANFSTVMDKASCVAARFPANTLWPDGTTRFNYTASDTAYEQSAVSYSNGVCSGKRQNYIPYWRLRQYDQDISQYVKFAKTLNPTRNDGSTNIWRGCIEEATTRRDATFSYTNLPDDLNPDLIPSTDANKWKPAWPDVIWDRGNLLYQDTTSPDEDDNYGGTYRQTLGFAACGMEARRLGSMTASEVSNYVNANDFRAQGGTYHDVGMIWGARFLSKNGAFASDNDPWPGRKPPSRSIVFMTDGQMQPNTDIYGMYGLESLDRRVTSDGGNTQALARHTSRFRAVCDYVKNRMDVTIFVVALGVSLNSDLEYCASPGYAYEAKSTDKLKAAFKEIATKVAMLRVSK